MTRSCLPWSVALSREERQTTNKETEMDKINPDNDKCYEENRTSRVTRMALEGGSPEELWGIREDFPEGLAKGIRRDEHPFCSVQFSLYSLATLCAPGLCPVSCHPGGLAVDLGGTLFLSLPVPQTLSNHYPSQPELGADLAGRGLSAPHIP